MLLIKVFIVIALGFQNCAGDAPQTEGVVAPLPAAPPNEPKCNYSALGQTESNVYKFQLPTMDMTIQNERNLHVIQEHKRQQQLFVLNGNELFQLLVSREEKRLFLIGLFAGSITNAKLLGAQVILWHNYFIFVVALEEQLEIYQIAEQHIKAREEITKDPQRANTPPLTFEPIQRLSLPGRYQQHFIVEPEEEQIILIVAANLTKLFGRLRTYAWSNTYFDPIEELTVPPMHVVNVVGSLPKYLVIGRNIKQQTKTILTVYEIKLSDMKLRNRQTLTVAARKVHAATFRGRNYLIACASNQKLCSLFRMVQGQFQVFKQRSSHELGFDNFIAGAQFLLATDQNEIKVFTNGQLDCYTSLTTNETDVTAIQSLANEQAEHFILLIYKRPFYTLVRMIEMVPEAPDVARSIVDNINNIDDDFDTRKQHQYLFEDTIGKLRSILLQRKTTMDVFRQISDIMSPKIKNLKLNNPLNMHAGKIGLVKLTGKNLRSPLQLLARIEEMKLQLGSARTKRSTGNSMQSLKVKQLNVRNLIYEGNVLKGFHLDKSTQPFPTITVGPKVTTRVFNTMELHMHEHFEHLRSSRSSDNVSSTAIKTRKLNVQRINNMPWQEFYDAVFLRNRDTKIQGSLTLQDETKVVNLWTTKLNELVVDQLFNLKHPQVISANIQLSRFYARDLRVERINGLNFAEDIVFSGTDSLVKTPVIMYQVSIADDLLLEDNTKAVPINQAPAATRLQQHYINKVILNGSLTVTNLSTFNVSSTQILLNGSAFSADILKEHYLLKNTPQNFSKPIIFGNAKVTTPSLSTNFLNGHATCQHLLTTDKSNITIPLYIVFMAARIEGDLICKDYNSSLLEMHRNAVRHGEVANITAPKVFEAPLTVDKLMTLALNDLPVSDLILKSQLAHGLSFTGVKHFENLLVEDIINVAEHLNSSYLNNLPLDELLNYDYQMDRLHLPHRLNVSNIAFHQINDISFDRVFSQFNIRDEQLILHKDLIIEGNVKFGENLEVEMINNVDWNSYQQSLVRVNEENAVLQGHKRFLKELTITKTFISPLLNDINMTDVFANKLSRSKPQLITGAYTFDSLSATNLDVSVINDLATAALIDLRAEEVVIAGDVVVPKLTVNGSIKGQLENAFQFDAVKERLLELPKKQWRNLVVLGNAHWNTTGGFAKMQNDRLQYLYKNAVRRTGQQTITGNVRLTRPLITKMLTQAIYPDNIDFDFIAKDCLLKNSTNVQEITGPKNFMKPLHMQSMEAKSLLSVKRLNNIDILRFNASLYRLSSNEIINGRLTFKTPPVVGRLAVEGFINGLRSAQIHHTEKMPLPPLRMKSLIIDDSLEIGDINDMSLNFLLENRVTKHGDALEVFGFLTFENLILNKDLLLQSINGIPIDNLVYKRSNQLQAITGTKVTTGDLVLTGPVHVMRLNGNDLIESYQQSVFTNRNQYIDNLVVDQAIFESGLVLQNEFDAHKERVNPSKEDNDNDKLKEITLKLLQMETANSNSTASVENQHLLYLDYDFDTEVQWRNPNETYGKTFTYETERLSVCERRLLHVQKSKIERRLFISNQTTSFVTANAYNFSIKAENFCTAKYRKVKSKITIAGCQLSKVFGMKKFIENVEFYSPDRGSTIFVLLHAIDLTANRNEFRILKISDNRNDITDWQSITAGVGRVMQLFQLGSNEAVILSAAVLANQPAVSIYGYESETVEFKLIQIIEGDYDIMQMVPIQSQKHQLILSCRHCQRLNIYEYSAEATPKYQIIQMLKFESLIDKFVAFSLDDGSWYMLVLSKNAEDYYHLYKYTPTQGWQQATYGYFHNIKLAIPLIDGHTKVSDGNALLLLCSSDKCNLIRAAVH